jgi:ribosomal protein S18 acetylase RimI-like enzyme/nitroimidazol reductase NimA-like FMN-containing flavoprotein (pyridoxamine 5'-phosphate oxidase superfamily)
MPHTEARAMFERAPFVHLATTGPDGLPVLRVLHMVISDEMLCFHGAPVGEKSMCVGRPAVVTTEQVVAEIPSYWVDPVMACPATTLYLSAQVHGMIVELTEPAQRARALQKLMQTFQPEGGHAPITHDDPRYTKAIAGLFIAGISLDHLDGKAKLGQNRTPPKLSHLVHKLWERGAANDPRAMVLMLKANPSVERPAFLQGPHGCTLEPWVDASELPQVLPLLRNEYWNRDRYTDNDLAMAHQNSSAWVAARAPSGELIATARVVSDGVKYGYIGDVATRSDWRNKGVGEALLRMLLTHPAVRNVTRLELATRDAVRLYERLGFAVVSAQHNGEFVRTTMARVQRRASCAA